MKILQVITKFGLGGAEEVAINLATGLAQKGHQVRVVTVVAPKPADQIGAFQKQRLESAGIETIELGGPNSRVNALYVPSRLASLIRSWKPDLVHAHTDIPDFMVSLATRRVKVPLVRTIHNSELWPTHRLMGRISETNFNDDLVVHISKGAKKAYLDLRKRFDMLPSKTQINIPNGIPVPSLSERAGRPSLEAEFGADSSKLLLCFAGRFTSQKGFDVLLGALEEMPEKTRNKLQIHAFGSGEDKEKFEKQVARKGLPVLFHDPVPGLGRLFPAFDAVVMPSRFEGFALVPLECQAVGVPVICTRAPGLQETVSPDWPLMVPVEDTVELGQLLTDICDGKHDLKALGARAEKWAARFSVPRMVAQYDDAYRKFLGVSGASR